MKKVLLFLFSVLSFFSAISTASADIVCPNGYSGPFTIQETYTYPPSFVCNVSISFCCKWDNTQKTSSVEIEELWETGGGHCLAYIPNWSDFLLWLHEIVLDRTRVACEPPITPCDDEENPFFIHKISSANCIYYQNMIKYPGDDIYSLVIKKCPGSVYCLSTWRICYDYDLETIRKTFVSMEMTGSAYCSETKPTLPPQGKGWEEAWYTECFLWSCE